MNAWGRTNGANSRRRIRGARSLSIAALALAASLAIAACGGGGGGGIEPRGGESASAGTVTVSGKPSGELTISNWPLYIDKQTVPDFEKATGVSVKYAEDVNSNEEFFAKMQPLLSNGQAGGRSLMVVTDWMVKKMHELGYLQE